MDCSNTKSGAAIYFAEVENSIKIGVSLDPTTRAEELQTQTGKNFNIVGLIHGGYETERYLHHRFKEYRLYGEYFSRAVGLMDFIDTLSSSKPCHACQLRLGESNILRDALDLTTRRVITEAIEMVGNSNADISARIGMSKRNLYRVRRRLGI